LPKVSKSGAINHDIDVLVDKPITAPILIDKDESYKKIYNDYLELSIAVQKHPKSNVIVIAPRRYHKGFTLVQHYLENFLKKYEIPITFIDIFHAEGQWNMPDEFFYRENHPYKYGYGELLHSGYHFVDLLCYFENINNNLAGMSCEKIKLASVHTTPYDFLHQINQQAYRNILNSSYEKFYRKSSLNQLKKFGEVDLNAICQFIRGDAVITTGVLNLLQTSFSRRMQSSLPKDTYKNNGRVREEHIILQVGTLLCVLIDSNQTGETKDIGCNENFVIQFFRNAGLIGGQVYDKLEITDNTKDIKLYQEARKEIILDWLEGNRSATNLLDHRETEYFITKLYESITNQNKGEMSFIQYQVK